MVSKTEYVKFKGKAFWAKLYQPDEYRGAVRWTMNLVMDDPKMWELFKLKGIQKKVKESEDGNYFPCQRPVMKLMKGSPVYFTPPIIYDKNGEVLVKYTDKDGKDLRSYTDKDAVVERVGETVLIGNGSEVVVTLSVYPTAMGPGNRLESVQVIDLIEYKQETPAEAAKMLDLDDEILF